MLSDKVLTAVELELGFGCACGDTANPSICPTERRWNEKLQRLGNDMPEKSHRLHGYVLGASDGSWFERAAWLGFAAPNLPMERIWDMEGTPLGHDEL